MDGFLGFLFGAAIGGVVIYLTTFAVLEGGWKSDCEKIGYHVSASEGAKVYKCELRK